MNMLSQQPLRLPDFSLRAHYEERAGQTLAGLWRRRGMIAALAAAALAIAGLALLLVLPKTYSAETLLQLDFGGNDAARGGAAPTERVAALDAITLVESEARVIRSRAIARRVVERLRLQDDPAFAEAPSRLAPLLAWLWPRPVEPEDEPRKESLRTEFVAMRLMRSLSVTNDTRSYLITIAFTSRDPARSATIVNAFADEYLRNRIDANVASAERASSWLAGQIAGAKLALGEAQARVDEFRQRTGFVETDAEGATVLQKALSDLNGQIGAATLARMNEEGKLARAREAFASGNVPSALDLAGAPVLQRLLENEATARRELADLALIGPKHPGLPRAKATVEEAQARVREQVGRAIVNLEGEVRAASAVENGLQARLTALSATLIGSKGFEAQFKNLQADVAAVRARLKLLTESYEQTVALAGWRNVAAQVVVPAKAVPVPSGPNPLLVLVLGGGGGLVMAIALAFLLERRDTGYRTAEEVASDLGLRCLGMVPRADGGSPEDLQIFRQAVRQVGASLSLGFPEGPKTVLVTSSVPQEGKSLLALALAKSVVGTGARALVIDWIPAPPTAAGARQSPSLDKLLDDQAAELFSLHHGEGAMLLRPSTAVPEGLYASAGFAQLLDRARAHFDLIVLEAPPTLLVSDVSHLARAADAVVHVVAWHATARRTVGLALQTMSNMGVRVQGVVLTKVDMAAHRRLRTEDQCSNYSKYRPFYRQIAARPSS